VLPQVENHAKVAAIEDQSPVEISDVAFGAC
jgi:hypothetical protein